jgi:hypothetical protein
MNKKKKIREERQKTRKEGPKQDKKTNKRRKTTTRQTGVLSLGDKHRVGGNFHFSPRLSPTKQMLIIINNSGNISN